MNNEALVTVATFATEMEAHLAKGALEAAGIQALVPDEGLGSLSRNRGGISSTTVQVFASDCDRATAELRRIAMRAANTKPRDTHS